MNLGYEIKSAREFRGYTQANLAQVCGVSRHCIARVENDHDVPSLRLLRKIAEVLHCKLEIKFVAMRVNV